jgi:hypothetical protein
MRVKVNITQDNMTINETFSGRDAEEVVAAMKSRVARELPFALRLAAGAMSPLMFAQEVVKRYNSNQKKNLSVPNSCAEFLSLASNEGLAIIEENG